MIDKTEQKHGETLAKLRADLRSAAAWKPAALIEAERALVAARGHRGEAESAARLAARGVLVAASVSEVTGDSLCMEAERALQAADEAVKLRTAELAQARRDAVPEIAATVGPRVAAAVAALEWLLQEADSLTVSLTEARGTIQAAGVQPPREVWNAGKETRHFLSLAREVTRKGARQ